MDHKLTKFIAIAELGSLTAAAESLHVSQPALTVALRELESSYRQPLLTRSSKGMRLTRAGEVVYATAIRMRDDERQLRARLMTQDYRRPLFRLGLLDSIAVDVVLATSMQWANYELRVDNTDRLLRDIHANRLDMAVVTGPKPELTNYRVGAIGLEPFSLVRASSLELKPGQPTPWVAYNQDSHTYAHFTRQFLQQGITPIPVCYSTSIELMTVLCEQGHGVALLPAPLAHNMLREGRLASVAEATFNRPLWLIERKIAHNLGKQADNIRVALTQRY